MLLLSPSFPLSLSFLLSLALARPPCPSIREPFKAKGNAPARVAHVYPLEDWVLLEVAAGALRVLAHGAALCLAAGCGPGGSSGCDRGFGCCRGGGCG